MTHTSAELVVYDALSSAELARHRFGQDAGESPCPDETGITKYHADKGDDVTRGVAPSPEELRSWLEQWVAAR